MPHQLTTGTERRALLVALGAEGNPSVRLRAALAAGSSPAAEFVPALVERLGAEPDFFVRDMLTWALVRHPAAAVLPLLRPLVDSPVPQARAQALHTLSKIAKPGTWGWITDETLADPDDAAAMAAWRCAVILVPESQRGELARRLVVQLGRGSAEVQRGLAMAFLALGSPAESALEGAASTGVENVNGEHIIAAVEGTDNGVVTSPSTAAEVSEPDADRCSRRRAHARAALRLLRDPDAGFGYALEEANREVALEFRAVEEGLAAEG